MSACRVSRLKAGAADADAAVVTPPPHPMMAALVAGVPLSLLMDLAGVAGPDSARILRREVADTSWLRGLGSPGIDRSRPSAAAG